MLQSSIWTALVAGFLLVLSLSACNNQRNTPPPPPPCPAGQVPSPAGCRWPGDVVPPIGHVPHNGVFQYFSSKEDFLSPQDTFFPTDKYKEFLRDALGVCERCTTSIGEVLQCNSWQRGFNMMTLSFAGGNQNMGLDQVSFYATPKVSNGYFQFAWQFPRIEEFFLSIFTGAPTPSCNPGQFSPYWATFAGYKTLNNDQGFLLGFEGPFFSRWNLHRMQIIVSQGKIGDPQFQFELTVIDKGGSEHRLATGVLTRCTYPNCGMF